MKIVVFWDVTPCILEGSYGYVRGICSFHFAGNTLCLNYKSILKTEAEFSSETSVNLNQITRRYNTEGNNFYQVFMIGSGEDLFLQHTRLL
jgi:hypothetical protein